MQQHSRRRKKFLGFDHLESKRLLSITPNDTYFSQQWGLHSPNDVDINAPEAWTLNTGTASTIIAVIGPTGVDTRNPDLANRLWNNPAPFRDPRYPNAVNGWNFDSNSPVITDTNGHDTNVAGIIAAQSNNGQGIAGVTWGSPLMVLKATTISSVASAVDFAVANGAKVINLSVGWGSSPTYFPFDPLYQAIRRAANSGVVVVAAAGNGGVSGNTNHAGQDLGKLTSQSMTVAPASYRLPNMLTVASVDSSGNLSSFSNYGATMVDLAAPGEMINTTGLGNGYISWAGGTSFAAPFVTGVVALVMSQHPEFTAEQVVERIVSTTKPLPSLTGKTISGGMVDAYKALLVGLPDPPTNLTAKPNGSHEINLTWTASASPFTTGYKIERSPNGVSWTQIAVVDATAGSFRDTGLSGTTQHHYRITALSTHAGDSAPAVALVTTASAPSGSISIDAGGDASGAYSADTGFRGGSLHAGSAAVNTSGVTDPAPQSVYQTERYGNFTYTISGLLPGGSYDVRLDFAEIYFTSAGQRVFNVAINGESVLKNFDIAAATGGINRAIAYTYPSRADSTGRIEIGFTSVVNNAKVSGIRVTPATTPTPIAIDAGGQSSGTYSADTGFRGGSLYAGSAAVNTSGVTDPAPQSVYQTERYGNFTYTISGLTPGGSYDVRLDFAEIYFTSAGQRVFNVAINGESVLKNFDIAAATGGINRAIAYTYPSRADSTGRIEIGFTSVVNNAKVSGIRVTPATTPAAPPPVDLAKGRPVHTSSVESSAYSAQKTVDGDSTTRWSSGQWTRSTSVGWIYVDLGSSQSINKVVLNWEQAYAVDFLIQVSHNGKSWTTLQTVKGNTSAGWQDYDGLEATGRYVRIYCTRTSLGSNNYSLYDFSVF